MRLYCLRDLAIARTIAISKWVYRYDIIHVEICVDRRVSASRLELEKNNNLSHDQVNKLYWAITTELHEILKVDQDDEDKYCCTRTKREWVLTDSENNIQ